MRTKQPWLTKPSKTLTMTTTELIEQTADQILEADSFPNPREFRRNVVKILLSAFNNPLHENKLYFHVKMFMRELAERQNAEKAAIMDAENRLGVRPKEAR